jgi:RNA polymerase sigma-70 factor (ECF subfamily)
MAATPRIHDGELDPLVLAARGGGDWAFGRIWELLSPSVAGYVRARGVRDADDVVSNVFLAAFNGMSDFVGGGARFRSWLFTIAHHKSVDALREQSRRGGHDPYLPELDDRAAPSAEAQAFDRLATDEVRRLLAALTPDQRDVLELRVLGDLTVAQTAQVLGRSEGAVKQLQRRAVDQLRRRLPQPVPLTAVPAITESR